MQSVTLSRPLRRGSRRLHASPFPLGKGDGRGKGEKGLQSETAANKRESGASGAREQKNPGGAKPLIKHPRRGCVCPPGVEPNAPKPRRGTGRGDPAMRSSRKFRRNREKGEPPQGVSPFSPPIEDATEQTENGR